MENQSQRKSWLRRLGLHRRELRAWALYDCANSAFVTTVMAAVLPVYYHQVAAVDLPSHMRTVYWGYTQTAAMLIIAVLAPTLGAAADYLAAKKKFLALFMAIGATSSFLLYFAGEGAWLFASIVFVAGNVGYAGSEVFYESLLPHVAKRDEIDQVSTAGYALGYVGGGVLLALQAAWIAAPHVFGLADSGQASRVAFASVGVWWILFSIPIFRSVAEPSRRLRHGESARLEPLRASFGRLLETFRTIREHRQAFVFLLAFWCYNDGINTIIKMATIYGAEIGIGQTDLIGALLLVQFLGIPFTFAYGALAERIGAKRGVYLALWVYTGISVFGYFMTEAWQFWALACAVAVVQGGSQALSRSLFASMIPTGRSSEFFGFYSVSGKFGNVIGPLVFSAVSQLAGGSRLGILSLVGFFLVGMVLLRKVDVEAGAREAQRADEQLCE